MSTKRTGQMLCICEFKFSNVCTLLNVFLFLLSANYTNFQKYFFSQDQKKDEKLFS